MHVWYVYQMYIRYASSKRTRNAVGKVWKCSWEPSRNYQVASEMLSGRPWKAKSCLNTPASTKKITFLKPAPPWGRPQTPQNPLPKPSRTNQKQYSTAYAYWHQCSIGFGLSERGFWIANQLTFRTTFTCFYPFQFIFNFCRMSLAICLFLKIANTVFWHHEEITLTNFARTSWAPVRDTKHSLKSFRKFFPNQLRRPPQDRGTSTRNQQ